MYINVPDLHKVLFVDRTSGESEDLLLRPRGNFPMALDEGHARLFCGDAPVVVRRHRRPDPPTQPVVRAMELPARQRSVGCLHGRAEVCEPGRSQPGTVLREPFGGEVHVFVSALRGQASPSYAPLRTRETASRASLSAVRRRSVSRLSQSCLPLAKAISTLTLPFLK